MRSMCWVGLGAVVVLLVLAVPGGCPPTSTHEPETAEPTGSGTTGDTDADTTYEPPADTEDDGGAGTVTGTIVDAQTGAPLEGVQVAVAGSDASGGTATDHSAWTDGNGKFTLSNVPAGQHYLALTLAGYTDYGTYVTVVADAGVDVAGAMIKSNADAIGIILTWGTVADQPRDLDLHLSGPDGNGGRFHVYYASTSAGEAASLDHDDTDWGGPETIVIKRTSSGEYVPGEYHVWVHNFGGSPEFGNSGASVKLTVSNQQVADYWAISVDGDGSLDIWRVVNFMVDAEGAVSGISPQQTFADGTDSSVY